MITETTEATETTETTEASGIIKTTKTTKTTTPSPPRNFAEDTAKWLGILVTLGGFLWGIVSFYPTYSLQVHDRQLTERTQADARLLEARKPFLDYQLKLYKEAVQVTQVIATTKDPVVKQQKTDRFWQLHWGEMGMVENGGIAKQTSQSVEKAMTDFGDCLKNPTCSSPTEDDLLPSRSLALAHACRNSLAASYGVPDWQSPDDEEQTKATPTPKPSPSK